MNFISNPSINCRVQNKIARRRLAIFLGGALGDFRKFRYGGGVGGGGCPMHEVD